MEDNYFVAVDGRKFQLQPVNPLFLSKAVSNLEMRWREQGEPLDAPSYIVELAGGDKQVFKHDEKSILQRNDPALTEQWEKYKSATERLEQAQAQLRSEILIREGFAPASLQAEFDKPEWKAKYIRYGVEPPAEPNMDYIKQEILRTGEDVIQFTVQVTRLSYKGQVPEEEIKRLEELFRSSIPTARITNRLAGVSAEEPANEQEVRELGAQPIPD